MAAKYRNLVSTRTRVVLASALDHSRVSNTSIIQNMRLRLLNGEKFAIEVPVPALFPVGGPLPVSNFIEEFQTDGEHLGWIEETLDEPHLLRFGLNGPAFSRDVLKATLEREPGGCSFRLADPFFPGAGRSIQPDSEPHPALGTRQQTVLVEFSSPNVAKPFHPGHLRSTIVGNFVANIYEAMGHKVVRINYLGDWGTQFGYLAAGLERRNIRELHELDQMFAGDNSKIIRELYNIYVEANRIGEVEEGFAKRAKELFAHLEAGDQTLRDLWMYVREHTIQELQATYDRLNVSIDHHHGESMYGGTLHNQLVLQQLTDCGLLKQLEDGRKVVDLSDQDKTGRVVICKSDGSSLYITRDLAAAIDRAKTFQFDKMLYVVEHGQARHFSNMFSILRRMGHGWAADLEHVKFGRIEGMSSRRGTVVFLSDILNEGRSLMHEQQASSPNTPREALANDQVADHLAISAVVCNDLVVKRTKGYAFGWDTALRSKGDSGIKLQYTHARLASLVSKMGGGQSHDCHIWTFVNEAQVLPELREPEALRLVHSIAVYDEALRDAFVQLEPRVLVKYLYCLCDSTSKALKTLGVKHAASPAQASSRLALFAGAKSVLRDGMKILGLRPLDQM